MPYGAESDEPVYSVFPLCIFHASIIAQKRLPVSRSEMSIYLCFGNAVIFQLTDELIETGSDMRSDVSAD